MTALPPWQRISVPQPFGCSACGCTTPREIDDQSGHGAILVWATCSQGHVYLLFGMKVLKGGDACR